MGRGESPVLSSLIFIMYTFGWVQEMELELELELAVIISIDN